MNADGPIPKCGFEGCQQPGVKLAVGVDPGFTEPRYYCAAHAWNVADQCEPVAHAKCPNCACYFGVG